MIQKNKIKVCFVLQGAYPHFNPKINKIAGGAELQMFLLATKLAENKNFEISFIVGDYKQKEIETIKNVKLIKSFNAKRNHKFIKIFQAFKFLKIIKKEKPDVIISTTNNTLVFLSSIYSKFANVKHIHRIAHNNDTSYERIKEFGFLGKLYLIGMKKANIILAQNEEQQKNLISNFNKKSILLKNVFPIKNQETNNKKHILWVGRFQNWKNPNLFIELALKIKDEQFIMVCPYSKKDEKEWLKMKSATNNISNINIIKEVPFNKIQNLFNEAKLFVNTSKQEGFPNTFLQSAQAKTPIVSLNVNPDNFINTYNCGIFCNNNFEKLIKETKLLLKDEDLLKTKGNNAFKYLDKNHNIEKISKQLENIIKTL
ncbi:MAG: glycosyltransferase family 4 protein [Chlorobi bacterium]|nr:glycosyltransferase family 4 protein [Chlorobiota bacterium]